MSRTNRNSQPLSSVERGQRLPREGKDASPRRPLDGIVALAPTDSILADQRRAAATATAVALRSAELEAAVSAEGESTEDLLESILPEGSHVPEFRLVPRIPTPGIRAANDGGALFDRSGRPQLLALLMRRKTFISVLVPLPRFEFYFCRVIVIPRRRPTLLSYTCTHSVGFGRCKSNFANCTRSIV